jgi:hypothetical protein
VCVTLLAVQRRHSKVPTDTSFPLVRPNCTSFRLARQARDKPYGLHELPLCAMSEQLGQLLRPSRIASHPGSAGQIRSYPQPHSDATPLAFLELRPGDGQRCTVEPREALALVAALVLHRHPQPVGQAAHWTNIKRILPTDRVRTNQ